LEADDERLRIVRECEARFVRQDEVERDHAYDSKQDSQA